MLRRVRCSIPRIWDSDILFPREWPERSEVNKAARIRAKNVFIYIVEGVRDVAWQQCKRSLNDVREREGC